MWLSFAGHSLRLKGIHNQEGTIVKVDQDWG
jgi:hypothetical protein